MFLALVDQVEELFGLVFALLGFGGVFGSFGVTASVGIVAFGVLYQLPYQQQCLFGYFKVGVYGSRIIFSLRKWPAEH